MVCLTYNTLHIFSPHPEPFEEDATDSDSFPPNLPKSPTTSSLPSPVNHTFSSPTSSHSSFNTTALTSGESCFHPTLPHLFLSTDRFFSFGPLLSPATLLYPPLLAALSNSSDLSLFSYCVSAHLYLFSCDNCQKSAISE